MYDRENVGLRRGWPATFPLGILILAEEGYGEDTGEWAGEAHREGNVERPRGRQGRGPQSDSPEIPRQEQEQDLLQEAQVHHEQPYPFKVNPTPTPLPLQG